MIYSVFIEKSAKKELTKIGLPDRDRIITAIRKLSENPRPLKVKKLTGREAWRIRIGNYRVIYEIKDDQLIVLVITIGHRREIYR